MIKISNLAPKQKIKFFILILILVMTVLGIIISIFYKPEDKKTTTRETSYNLPTKDKINVNDSSEAYKGLERPGDQISDDRVNKVKKALDAAINYIKSNDIKMLTGKEKGYYNLAITTPENVRSVKSMMMSGYVYQPDSLKVYYSNSKDVYQFMISLKKDSDSSIITYAGNYVANTDQIEIRNFYGTPTGMMN